MQNLIGIISDVFAPPRSDFRTRIRTRTRTLRIAATGRSFGGRNLVLMLTPGLVNFLSLLVCLPFSILLLFLREYVQCPRRSRRYSDSSGSGGFSDTSRLSDTSALSGTFALSGTSCLSDTVTFVLPLSIVVFF